MMIRFFSRKLLLCVILAAALLLPAAVHAQSTPKPVLIQALGDSSWMPYFHLADEEDSKDKGIFLELTDILFDKLGYDVHRHPLPWKRAQDMVRTGEADFMITIPTVERGTYTYRTAIPLHHMYLHLYTHAGHPKADQIATIKTAKDIKKLGLTLAAHLGDGWYKANMAPAGINTKYITSDDNILKIVAARRVDGMIEPVLPANRSIRELGLEENITLTTVKFGPTDFYILISRLSPLVLQLDEINAALIEMRDNGTIRRIERKYDAKQH